MIEAHLTLLRDYDHVAKRLQDPVVRERFEEMVLPNIRVELNKLYETVFSLGGSAPTGSAIDWSASGLSGSDADMLKALIERDREHGRMILEEIDAVHHQERARAILGHTAAKSEDRLGMLRSLLSNIAQ